MKSVNDGKDSNETWVSKGDRVKWWSTPNVRSGFGKIETIEHRPYQKGDDGGMFGEIPATPAIPEGWRYTITTDDNETIRRWDNEISKA